MESIIVNIVADVTEKLLIAMSIGTQKICVEFSNGTATCEKLSLNITAFIPRQLTSLLPKEINNVQMVQDSLLQRAVQLMRMANVVGAIFFQAAFVIIHVVVQRYHGRKRWKRLLVDFVPLAIYMLSSLVFDLGSLSDYWKSGSIITPEVSQVVHLVKEAR